MIIKSIHVGETDLKQVGCLIRLSEEKQVMKSLRLDLLRDKFSHDLQYKFKAILTLLTL